MNYNKATIIGRATADPELRSTQGGESIVALAVATNRTWTDNNGVTPRTTEIIAEHLELGPKPQPVPGKVEKPPVNLGHVRPEDEDVVYVEDSQEIRAEDIPF